jgi:predicted ABC-type ATPase
VAKRRGRIVVACGTNGAGKSAIVGEFFVHNGGAYFNPDLLARRFVERGLSIEDANARAWSLGFEGLRRAIGGNQDFSFETTLGGQSITRELHRAAAAGAEVLVWYVGLASPELHIARVKARVARGGHDIPEGKIRERYSKSLINLIGLMSVASELHVFDNSEESADGLPRAKLVLRLRQGRIIEPDLDALRAHTPDWAKPVVASALKLQARKPGRRRAAPKPR